MVSSRQRSSSTLATLVVLAGAGGLCWMAATAAAKFIEDRSRQDISVAMDSAGYDWVDVSVDGLQVQLSGTAPDEVQRFRAKTQAATVVDQGRIVDEITVAKKAAITPPDFEVELLRNDEGIQLIGLVPAGVDRVAVLRRLKSETAAPEVTDLLEAADYPTPEGWDQAMEFGLRAAQMARRATVSIAPGKVSVNAITDSATEKARLETEFRRTKPDDLELTTQISAPRPVIAPFTLRFVMDEEGARFDACAADDDDARKRILEAAIAAGAKGRVGCTLGLGSPSPHWGDAAVASIQALAKVGAGTVTISDADVAVYAPVSVDRENFDAAVGELQQALPLVFSLQAEHEQPKDKSVGPVEFLASISGDHTLYMRGRITDDRMREAVDSFAQSRFSTVESSLRTDDKVPGGWTVRVIAALEAMAGLNTGSVLVTPDMLRITGTSGDQHAVDKAAAALSQRLGAGARYELAIRYDERMDPLLGLPTGGECVAQLNTIMAESAIGFEPNKSVIAGEPEETIARLGETMTDCAEFQIEIGGHTDSQGSEGFNADLSRARAQAILAAMSESEIDTRNMTARGYGESQPIDSNETEEGREANRRIEFRLMSELPVRNEPLPDPTIVSGVTEDAGDAAAAVAAQAGGEAPQGTADTTDADQAAEDAAAGIAAAVSSPAGPAIHVPSVVGADEDLADAVTGGLDLDEENVTLPVLTPDDDTPRPAPRPGEGAEPQDDDEVRAQ